MNRYILLVLALIILFCPIPSSSEPTIETLSFSKAKKLARDVVYKDHKLTIYCGCEFKDAASASGGVIDSTSCMLKPRKNKTRSSRLEWEHIVPISMIGQKLSCWNDGHPKCVKNDGKTYKGRKCCGKVDDFFKHAEGDLHNLAPAVGEVNGDRSNHPYGIVDGEERVYGTCDFEIGGSPKVAEPTEAVRGNVARATLYMSAFYGLKLTTEERAMFEDWSKKDLPDKFECERDRRIQGAQGNSNPYVAEGCKGR